VQERQAVGPWKGGRLIGKRTRPVRVLKERKTRFVLAARLAGKPAAETASIMMAVFRQRDPVPARFHHLRQRHRLRPEPPAGERLCHGDP
jgi:IS30 family transposase